MEQVNLARLKKCMQRAANGEEITIGFIGGSITQGSLATKHENTYAYRGFLWWKEKYPKSQFYYVNAGIGGTNSHYGVSRCIADLLMYQPDFVVVDFSVNDEAEEFFQETYEGLIRKLLTWKSQPAVLILNNVFYDTGENAQDYHNQIGDWYHVPHVSIKDTIFHRMRQGMYTKEELTSDGLHPNDKGHLLLAEEIIAFLENARVDMDYEEENTLPEPLTSNAYENAKRLTIREWSPELNGFHADSEEKTGHLDAFKNGWVGKKAGDRICFEVEASCIAVQYRKTISKPALCARLVLDNSYTVLLEGNFEEDWGDCQFLEPILHHGEHGVHTVEIEILQNENINATPFYLMSLVVA